MLPTGDTTPWVPLVAIIVQTLGLGITGTWLVSRSISKLETTLTGAISTGRKELDHSIALVENELRDRITGVSADRRQALESAMTVINRDLAVVRDRLHDHQLHVREHYVRRDSFYKVADEIKVALSTGLNNLERKIERVSSTRS